MRMNRAGHFGCVAYISGPYGMDLKIARGCSPISGWDPPGAINPTIVPGGHPSLYQQLEVQRKQGPMALNHTLRLFIYLLS